MMRVPGVRDGPQVATAAPSRRSFHEVARRDAVPIWELHLSLTASAAMTLDEGVIAALVAKGLLQAGCRVRIRLSTDTEMNWQSTGMSGLEKCAN